MTTCDQCLWGDMCPDEVICTYFTMLIEDYDDIIEQNRLEFRRDWCDYAYYDDADNFFLAQNQDE